MAQKSKTQRAKASARRAERKAAAALAEAAPEVQEEAAPEEKKGLFKRSSEPKEEQKVLTKKEEPKKKGGLFKKDGFIANVRAEMKRVTWPTRQEVLRWSGVVVAALIFFVLYTFVLDNWVVTPLLIFISGLGA